MRQDISVKVASDLPSGRAIYRTLESFLDNEVFLCDDERLANVYYGHFHESIDVTSVVLYTFEPAPENQIVTCLQRTIERARYLIDAAVNSTEYISGCCGGAKGFIDTAERVHTLAEDLVPSPEESSNRRRLVQLLNDIVSDFDPETDLCCEVFGSYASQLNTEMSDLDLSLEGLVDCGPGGWVDISEVSGSTKKNILRHLGSVFRQNNEFQVKITIHGRISILKIFHRPTCIHCDICLSEDCTAWPKAQLFLCLNMIDDKFRLLVNLVMRWATEFGIKNGAEAKLNSFTLTLLVIFHLQTRPDPVLPALKSIMPGEKRGLQSWSRFEVARGGRSKAIKTMAWKTRVWAEKHGGQNDESLLELFLSFMALMDALFRTWNVRIHESAGRLLRVSAYHSCIYLGEDPLNNNGHSSNQRAPGVIFVEDPFDKEINSARSVSKACVNSVIDAANSTLQSFQQCPPPEFMWDAFGCESNSGENWEYSSSSSSDYFYL